jgi:hypothetical protein
MDDDDADFDEDEEMADADAAGRPKVPAWDTLVYDDPERYLTVLERVDREEERKKRRERMLRDQKEEEERQLAEAMAAAEAAQRALEAEGGGKKEDEPETKGKADAKGKGKAKDCAPSTPSGKGGAETPLGKDGKPKTARGKKAKGDAGSGASTPAPATGGSTKNLAEDIKKRLTDQTALRSLGGQKFSWLNSSIGSPSPAGGGLGAAGNLPKPKFAPASALPPPSFAPLANGASTSTSMLNPANSAAAAGARAAAGGAGDETPAASAAAAALTTSRLNLPPMHDAQRTQLDMQKWEAGHHVVELQDLLFALDRERGMGVGSGSGRSAAIRGRSGITRGGYKSVARR